jgi:hypothetical protein
VHFRVKSESRTGALALRLLYMSNFCQSTSMAAWPNGKASDYDSAYIRRLWVRAPAWSILFFPQPLQGRGKCIVCWLKPLPAVSVTKQEAFLWVDSLRLFQGSIDYRVCSASQACSRLSRFIPESLWPAQRVPALLVAAEHKTSICVYQKKPAFHQRRFSSVGRATD